MYRKEIQRTIDKIQLGKIKALKIFLTMLKSLTKKWELDVMGGDFT